MDLIYDNKLPIATTVVSNNTNSTLEFMISKEKSFGPIQTLNTEELLEYRNTLAKIDALSGIGILPIDFKPKLQNLTNN